MDNLLLIGQVVLFILGGAVVALHGIAPLTKSTKDDKALVWLVKIEGWLRMLLPAPRGPEPKYVAPESTQVVSLGQRKPQK